MGYWGERLVEKRLHIVILGYILCQLYFPRRNKDKQLHLDLMLYTRGIPAHCMGGFHPQVGFPQEYLSESVRN